MYFAVFVDYGFDNNVLYMFFFLVIARWIHLDGLSFICQVFAQFLK